MNNLHIFKPVVRAITASGIVAFGLSTTVGSAAATNEFPAHSAATVTSSCSVSLGGTYHIDYTNVEGLSNAHFVTTVDGAQVNVNDLGKNETAVFDGKIADGVSSTIVISASDVPNIVTTVGPLDCFNGTSTITVDCVNDAPVMTAIATNTGQSVATAIFDVNDDNAAPSIASVSPGTSYTFTATLVDGAPYAASLRFNDGQGTEANVSGTRVCVPPTTQATVPETTAPPTTVAETIPPTTVLVAPPTTATPTTVALTVPVGTVLPSTGRSSVMVIWLGSIAVALGVMVIRAARRPRSMR